VLVLTRKPNEMIIIGDNIIVKIIEVRGQQVRIGIEAPGLKIDRLEIREKQIQPTQTAS